MAPDPYIDQLNPQAYAAPYNEAQAYQVPAQAVNPDAGGVSGSFGPAGAAGTSGNFGSAGATGTPGAFGATDASNATGTDGTPVANPNQYNTPELAAQIQMAQQAGQAAGGQTVSAQMMAQNPPEPGTAKQTYKAPLVIGTGIARAFAVLSAATVLVSIINFVANQLAGQLAGNEIYAVVMTVLARINTVAVFARVACVGFAVAATVIRVYNPHPYNTKNAIVGWIFALISLLALIIFR